MHASENIYIRYIPVIIVGVTTVSVALVVIIDVDIIVGTKLDVNDVIAKLDKVGDSTPAQN